MNNLEQFSPLLSLSLSLPVPLLAENVEQILGGGERGAPSARLLEEQPGPASSGSWKPAISTPGMAGGDLPLVEGSLAWKSPGKQRLNHLKCQG